MAVAPRLAPGTIFARDYQIVDLLAEGGMGAVYRAEQQSTRKPRALKLVSTRLATDPKGRQRFVREATVGASIDSEHVVEVIGAGVDDESGRPWLAMELLDGADLGAVVRHQGPLSPGQLRELAGQLCHGLAAAHRAGVVHRDLKPANVFIARSRRAGVPFTVKILDFGIAKVVQESGSGSSDTDTVGSPLWMAPEQLNAQRPTPATDVWALGLLAFWALTGKHYWISAHAEASTVQALFVEQLFKPLDPPSQRAAELGAGVTVPPGFDEWFLACTQRDPARRYDGAAAAGEALLALLPADPEAAARLLPHVTLPPSVSSSTERRPEPGSEITLTTAGAGWDASAVVPAAALAAARSGHEGETTHADTPGLGADLSHAPLPAASSWRPRRKGVSPVAVGFGVAALVGVLLGGGLLAWQALEREPADPLAEAQQTDELVEPPADLGVVATNEGSETTVSPPPEDAAATDPKQALVVPLRTQLDDEDPHDVRFLGWSEAGHRFALEVEYRTARKGQPMRFVLVQVHDAITGAMIESFELERDTGGSSLPRTLGKAAAEASPREQWPARREELRLRKGSPQHAQPGGETRLRIAAAEPPPGTSMTFPPSELGAAFRWSVDPAIAQAAAPRRAPDVRLSLERGEDAWTLVRFEPRPTTHELLARWVPGADEPGLVGRVLAYWSPDGERVVLVIEVDARPAGQPPLQARQWLLRAVGPQIRLVEAGAGQSRMRALAAELAKEGMPIAIAQLRAPPEAESRLLHAQDREDAAAAAERVRALLPLPLVPQATRLKRDQGDVAVILGYDAQ